MIIVIKYRANNNNNKIIRAYYHHRPPHHLSHHHLFHLFRLVSKNGMQLLKHAG
jgi:hypothetical protein